jgi:hypothetical protein
MLHGDNPTRLLAQLHSSKSMPSFWEISSPYEAVQWEYTASASPLPEKGQRLGPFVATKSF